MFVEPNQTEPVVQLQREASHQPPRIAVVGCRVMDLEVEALLGNHPNVVHVHWMEQGLHNDPPQLSNELQKVVREIERDYEEVEAIVLIYGSCSRGTENVTTRRCQLVLARAHDCITLLLGSRQVYANYVGKHPGTYWYSPGWNKHHVPPGPERYQLRLSEYTEKYGKENAEYLMETEQHWFSTYNRATFVHLTIGVTDTDLEYTKACANWLGWQYDELQGDLGLINDLLAGRWDHEHFLVLQPGQSAVLSNDEHVLKAIAADRQ